MRWMRICKDVSKSCARRFENEFGKDKLSASSGHELSQHIGIRLQLSFQFSHCRTFCREATKLVHVVANLAIIAPRVDVRSVEPRNARLFRCFAERNQVLRIRAWAIMRSDVTNDNTSTRHASSLIYVQQWWTTAPHSKTNNDDVSIA
jgi:hypothetical protein